MLLNQKRRVLCLIKSKNNKSVKTNDNLTQIKRLKLDESLEFRGNNQKLFYEEITKNDITFSISHRMW